MAGLLRKTKSVCPECLVEVEASIVEKEGRVYLEKTCPEHGRTSTVIALDSSEYKDLYSLYSFLKIPERLHTPHDRYTVYCTRRCNMNCPICVVSAGTEKDPEDSFSLSEFEGILRKNNIRGKKISLFGGEPTVRKDLTSLISLIRKYGNSVTLFTNGLRLADYSYLYELKAAGLKDIYLQFDGFDHQVEEMTRGRNWLGYKIKALENIKKLDMPVVFEVTTSREHNFQQMEAIFDYAAKNDFVRGICFRSYSMFGRKKLRFPRLTTDDIIAEVIRFTAGKVNKKEITVFTKILFIFAYIFKFKCCSSHRYLALKRVKGGYKTMSGYFDIDKIDKRFKKLTKLFSKSRVSANLYLFFVLIPGFVTFKSLPCLFDFLKVALGYKFGRIFSNSSFGKSYLIVEFDSPCDRLTVELDKVCNSATIMEDGAILSSFYESSLRKERKMNPADFEAGLKQ